MRVFFAIFTLFATLLSAQAKEHKLSNIPPVSVQYINLETQFCDESCLKELIAQDMLASFMARFEPSKISDSELLAKFNELGGNASAQHPNMSQSGNKIAVIIPQKTIKSYTNVVTNALLAYVAHTGAQVELKFIMSGDESEAAITNALNLARQQEARYIIAPFTPTGVGVLSRIITPEQTAIVPTLHASSAPVTPPNIIFGGVDYKAQIAELLKFSNDKIAAFNDGSALGRTLNQYARQLSQNEIFSAEVAGKEPDLQPHLSRKSRLNNSTFLLNLPVIKASLIASQLHGYGITSHALLSTQINYVPQLFNVIAQKDRDKLLVASSIDIPNDEIIGSGALFELDLRYSWIGYASSVALECIYADFIDTAAARLFEERLNGNQIEYKIKIFEAKKDAFTPISSDFTAPQMENFKDLIR